MGSSRTYINILHLYLQFSFAVLFLLCLTSVHSDSDFIFHGSTPIGFEDSEEASENEAPPPPPFFENLESGNGTRKKAGVGEGFEFGNVNQTEVKRKLCPNVTGSLDQVRYDVAEDKCSRGGQRGHCGENMIFYGVTHNEVYGRCDCNYNSIRPLIYYAETNHCYHVYEQAYCRRGEWLTFGQNGKPGCSFNKCQTPIFLKDIRYVPLNGTGPCVILGEKSAHCENPDHVVWFVQGELNPKCAKFTPGTRALALSRQLKCQPGTYMNVVGKCQPSFVW